MTGAEGLTIGAAAIRRRELTGKTGMSALMENKKAFFIAVFASFVSLHSIKDECAYTLIGLEVSYMATSKAFLDKPLSCRRFRPNSPPFTPLRVLLVG